MINKKTTMTHHQHAFSEVERAAVYRAINERRDMRHFLKQPIDAEVLLRLLTAFHQAPSVGLMQPWRIIRITEPPLRTRAIALKTTTLSISYIYNAFLLSDKRIDAR